MNIRAVPLIVSDVLDPNNAVTVAYRDGEWCVTVRENGATTESKFTREAHAASFADGQRMRLGLWLP